MREGYWACARCQGALPSEALAVSGDPCPSCGAETRLWVIKPPMPAGGKPAGMYEYRELVNAEGAGRRVRILIRDEVHLSNPVNSPQKTDVSESTISIKYLHPSGPEGCFIAQVFDESGALLGMGAGASKDEALVPVAHLLVDVVDDDPSDEH